VRMMRAPMLTAQRRQPEAAVQSLIGGPIPKMRPMKLLRDTPPAAANPAPPGAAALEQRHVVLQTLAETHARIDAIASRAMPARQAGVALRSKNSHTSPLRHGTPGSAAWYAARPACASDTLRLPAPAAQSRAPGARSAYTSLTMHAPAAVAAAITRGLAGVDRNEPHPECAQCAR
jgi:hypothetical protein